MSKTKYRLPKLDVSVRVEMRHLKKDMPKKKNSKLRQHIRI